MQLLVCRKLLCETRSLMECSRQGTLKVARYIPAVEQSEQLPGVVQVIARHPAEAEGVEVAEGDGGENHHRSSHLVQLGDVGVLKVQLHAVNAHHCQHTHGAQEEESPQCAFDDHPLIGEHVWDAVQRGSAGENFNGGWLLVVQVLRVRFEIHCGRREVAKEREGKKKTRDSGVFKTSGFFLDGERGHCLQVHALARMDFSTGVRHRRSDNSRILTKTRQTHPVPTYGSNQVKHRWWNDGLYLGWGGSQFWHKYPSAERAWIDTNAVHFCQAWFRLSVTKRTGS